jgi:hypothetical protein
MIEPQRDLHKAQNPGVLVSDPVSLAFNGVPRQHFGRRREALLSARTSLQALYSRYRAP